MLILQVLNNYSSLSTLVVEALTKIQHIREGLIVHYHYLAPNFNISDVSIVIVWLTMFVQEAMHFITIVSISNGLNSLFWTGM